jgi:hypothetical protein
MGLLFLILGMAIWGMTDRWSKAGFPPINIQTGQQGGSRRIPVAYRVDPAQRQAALEAYKHAVSEKMDVMRTAISMGWGDTELKRLDARLEELIGKDELKRLLDGEIPTGFDSSTSLDPQQEITRLRGAAQG